MVSFNPIDLLIWMFIDIVLDVYRYCLLLLKLFLHRHNAIRHLLSVTGSKSVW